jgi:SAM-dependent methyltransferase
MHPTAEAGFAQMIRTARFPDGWYRPIRVLDVGGADVNGTVHEVVRLRRTHVPTIDVLDVTPGPGVTIVADATDQKTWLDILDPGSYDLVISTETLEHVKDWRMIVWGAARVLRPAGWFIGTCASVGRRPHGARGEHDVPAGEWYGNVAPDGLTEALIDNFEGDIALEYSRRPGFPTTNDLYWSAQVSPC